MRNCWSLLIVVSVLGTLAAAPLNYRHHALVEVVLDSPAQLDDLHKLHLDVVPGESRLQPRVVALPEEMETLARNGFVYRIIHEDIEQFYADRARREGHLDDMGGFKTYDEIVAALDSMHARYPAITTARFSVGQSIQGRNLWCLKISDNPDSDEDEPEIFYNALIHAREPAGMEVVLYFMNYLLANYGSNAEVTDIVNNRELFFVPCVNPDGYVYNQATNPSGGGMWRKNRRNNGDGSYGIDLNRNWGLTWGLDNEGSSPIGSDETYRGTAAFSEPETAALRDFINARDFAGSMDYHTYSNLVLIPWGTSYFQGIGITPDDPEFRLIADSISTAISRVSGASYAMGTAWELLYNTNGGSFDWEYGDTTLHGKMFSISTEVGSSSDGFWPAPSRIQPLCAENLPANLFFARYVGTLRQGTPHVFTEPDALEIGLATGETTTRRLIVSNGGTRALGYRTAFSNATAQTDTGGPDAFGYRWQDSDDPCGPVFQWLPIGSLGTQLTFGANDGDAVRGPFTLGFAFPFYGHEYGRIWISANGWISFTDSVFTGTANRALPAVSAPAACICGWWDDLKPQLSGTNVRFWTNGADSAAAHFENVRAGTAPNQGTYNFQILLTARGEIVIFYGSMGTIRLNSATIAIQDHTRSRGLTILSNVLGVGDNEARRFALGPRWVSVTPTAGFLAPGEADTLTLFFDGSRLCGDPSRTALLLRSNDITQTTLPVPLLVTHAVPEPPQALTVHWDPEGMVLRWQRSPQAAGYIVERAQGWSGTFDPIAVTADTTFTDSVAHDEAVPTFYQVRATTQAASHSYSFGTEY